MSQLKTSEASAMTAVTKARRALPTGYQLEDYCIVSILGEGNFGITYLAQDTKQNYQVALKEFFPNELAEREENYSILPNSPQDEKNYAWGLGRFLQEGHALATFHHPNIVRVLHYFETHNTAYLVMEYEQGQSLANILKTGGTLTETEIMAILPPLLEGLQAVHEAGFLHQNIKPDCIYLRDKNHTPVLLDFGAARYALGHLRRDVTAIVTPGYAPFEQSKIKGPQGPWTDIYALGAVLYRAIAGKTPVEVLKRIDAIKRRKEADPLVPAITIGGKHYFEQLLQGIDWALQIAEEDRPQTIQQWAKALLPKKSYKSLNLYKVHAYPAPTQGGFFNQWVFASMILAIIGLSAGYVFYTEQRLTQLQQQSFKLQRLQQQSATDKTLVQQALENTQQQLEEVLSARETEQRHFLAHLESEKAALQQRLGKRLAHLESEKAALQQVLVKTQWQLEQAEKARDKAQPGTLIRDRLQDGSYGPEMVAIPAGRFRMGDIQGTGDDNEQPVHWVSVESFAIGHHEVTFAEYDRFAEATGREKPDDEGWGRGRRPVINVSWYDATAYAQWLSQQTGHLYRLPTETEWEYAARAGTVTPYWWGDKIKPNLAHCKGCGMEWNKTAPVSSFLANSFGLYDMSGNVREWTCSEYEDRYRGKEQLCINRQQSASYRVERGGSWAHPQKYMRVSSRYWSRPENRYNNVGFRVVKK
jgi:formylglycine-generating enzyme required for sulfatase activity/tRNA A-37 threonylcarbamoyl transferase component Bud32